MKKKNEKKRTNTDRVAALGYSIFSALAHTSLYARHEAARYKRRLDRVNGVVS